MISLQKENIIRDIDQQTAYLAVVLNEVEKIIDYRFSEAKKTNAFEKDLLESVLNELIFAKTKLNIWATYIEDEDIEKLSLHLQELNRITINNIGG